MRWCFHQRVDVVARFRTPPCKCLANICPFLANFTQRSLITTVSLCSHFCVLCFFILCYFWFCCIIYCISYKHTIHTRSPYPLSTPPLGLFRVRSQLRRLPPLDLSFCLSYLCTLFVLNLTVCFLFRFGLVLFFLCLGAPPCVVPCVYQCCSWDALRIFRELILGWPGGVSVLLETWFSVGEHFHMPMRLGLVGVCMGSVTFLGLVICGSPIPRFP